MQFIDAPDWPETCTTSEGAIIEFLRRSQIYKTKYEDGRELQRFRNRSIRECIEFCKSWFTERDLKRALVSLLAEGKHFCLYCPDIEEPVIIRGLWIHSNEFVDGFQVGGYKKHIVPNEFIKELKSHCED